MPSSQGGDRFDSSDSLIMITLSLGVMLKVRGEPHQQKPNPVYRDRGGRNLNPKMLWVQIHVTLHAVIVGNLPFFYFR